MLPGFCDTRQDEPAFNSKGSTTRGLFFASLYRPLICITGRPFRQDNGSVGSIVSSTIRYRYNASNKEWVWLEHGAFAISAQPAVQQLSTTAERLSRNGYRSVWSRGVPGDFGCPSSTICLSEPQPERPMAAKSDVSSFVLFCSAYDAKLGSQQRARAVTPSPERIPTEPFEYNERGLWRFSRRFCPASSRRQERQSCASTPIHVFLELHGTGIVWPGTVFKEPTRPVSTICPTHRVSDNCTRVSSALGFRNGRRRPPVPTSAQSHQRPTAQSVGSEQAN